MRIPGLAILAIAITSSAIASGQAHAQRYDPAFPVCLHVYPWGGSDYYDCTYQTMAQCAMSASGRGATCDPNPYFNRTMPRRSDRRYRRG